MDNEQLTQLIANFKTVAREHLETINQQLLVIEKSPEAIENRDAVLEEIFRTAHSVKGDARIIGFTQIETVGHQLESILGAIRDGQLKFESPVFEALYKGLDTIETLLNDAGDTEETPADLSKVLSQLKSIIQMATPKFPETAVAPQVSTKKMSSLEPVASGESARIEPVKPKVERIVVSDRSIRVDVSKLESLMVQANELLVLKITVEQRLEEFKKLLTGFNSQRKKWRKSSDRALSHNSDPEQIRLLMKDNYLLLNNLSARLTALRHEMSGDALRLDFLVDNIQDDLQQTRMLPFSTILGGFRRMVRDLAQNMGKDVMLNVTGDDIEVDKKVLQELRDPIMHLLRNSVDHGIEPSDEREALGKPVQSNLELTFIQKGNYIQMEVKDDGYGLDIDGIKQAALCANLVSEALLEDLSEAQIIDFIFQPGLSTSTDVTSVSGRGVGLDVVRSQIESLHGQVEVHTQPNAGTRFCLTVPLSLATTHGLLIRVQNQVYAIPTSGIAQILLLEVEEIHRIGGNEAVAIEDKNVALVRLSDVIGLEATPLAADALIKAVLLQSGDSQVAFVVDELIGEQEMVIKNLNRQLSRVYNIIGAMILGTGEVVMVLNPAELIRTVQGAESRRFSSPLLPGTDEVVKEKPTILVVDDSITTRTLEKNILETAGYQVVTATDGTEALQYLAHDTCDLIVSDIQMPRMDGFELTASIRNSSKLSHLPLILVTSLESQGDRERGLSAGADAYIVKSGFTQEDLLMTIRQLL